MLLFKARNPRQAIECCVDDVPDGKDGEKRCVLQHQKITRRLLHPIDLVNVLGHLFGGLFTNEMGSFFQLGHAGFDSRNVS